MKKCKFCSEEIRDEAIKCRFCGESLVSQEEFDKAIRDEQEELAAEGKALRQQKANELKNAVAIAIFDKKFIPSDPDREQYADYIQSSLAISNRSNKDIRALKAVLIYKDLFGDVILDVGYKLEDGIGAGAKKNHDIFLEYNQFDERLRKFAAATLDQVQLDLDVTMIIYADGTVTEKK